jgi:inner membrane protein involved in colicin E2 resistance
LLTGTLLLLLGLSALMYVTRNLHADAAGARA